MIAFVFCGNPNRSDDGVGPHLFRILKDRPAFQYSAIRLLDAGTDGMAVMFAARGCRSLILVDACRSGSEPGAVFELPGSELDARQPLALSTHDFRWEHALFAGRRIFRQAFPADVRVFLIEAATTELGTDLSPAVASAAQVVAMRLEVLVSELCLAPT